MGNPFAAVPVLTGTRAVQYFNKAAFARQAIGSFGNLGHNSFYGPGFGSADFSVFKKDFNNLGLGKRNAQLALKIIF